MYDHILVPTDGTDAVAGAVDLASAAGARLHTLRVVDTWNRGSLTDSKWFTLEEMLREEGMAGVEAHADETGAPVASTVERGVPHQVIVGYVPANDADPVVMGTHGRSGPVRILLGSVTGWVVRQSPVPVLVGRVGG